MQSSQGLHGSSSSSVRGNSSNRSSHDNNANSSNNSSFGRSKSFPSSLSAGQAGSPAYQPSRLLQDAVCQSLLPLLADLDAASLAALTRSLADLNIPLGPSGQQQLLAALWNRPLSTAAAAAAQAAGRTTKVPPPQQQQQQHGADGPVALAPGVVVELLQALLLLRCWPPLPLLQRVLLVAGLDLGYYKANELVGLLLLVVQLRVRPGRSSSAAAAAAAAAAAGA
jgi:hypothetical protein